MQTITMETTINASSAEVWKTLWEDETYRRWTSVFGENSHAKSDWKEGSKILFLGNAGNGMYAFIDKKVDNKQMTFRHMGEVKNNEEQPESPWAGAKEAYELEEHNGVTSLKVHMDVTEEMGKYFEEKFPAALAIVKKIAEAS